MGAAKADGGRTGKRSAVAVPIALGLLLGTAALARAGQVELASRVAPDQVSDTATGSNGAGGPGTSPSLSADGRSSSFRGACGVPATATAVTLKVTALQGSGKGNV